MLYFLHLITSLFSGLVTGQTCCDHILIESSPNGMPDGIYVYSRDGGSQVLDMKPECHDGCVYQNINETENYDYCLRWEYVPEPELTSECVEEKPSRWWIIQLTLIARLERFPLLTSPADQQLLTAFRTARADILINNTDITNRAECTSIHNACQAYIDSGSDEALKAEARSLLEEFDLECNSDSFPKRIIFRVLAVKILNIPFHPIIAADNPDPEAVVQSALADQLVKYKTMKFSDLKVLIRQAYFSVINNGFMRTNQCPKLVAAFQALIPTATDTAVQQEAQTILDGIVCDPPEDEYLDRLEILYRSLEITQLGIPPFD